MTTVTISILTSAGMNSDLLFPGSSRSQNNGVFSSDTLAGFTFRKYVNGVPDPSTVHRLYGYGDELTASFEATDISGYVTSLELKSGPDTSNFGSALIAVSITGLDGSSQDKPGIFLSTFEGLTVDSLMTRVANLSATSSLTLLGNVGADTLNGSFFDDTLQGGEGADILNGGEGNDIASYAGCNVAVSVNLLTGAKSGGHAAGDQFISIESIVGTAHNDTLTGDGQANFFDGGDGADTIRGGGGNDAIFGRNGGGTFYGDAGNDRIDGGNEDDVIYGGIGEDDLRPGRGTNTVYGEDGNDYIEADPSPSIDHLYGGAGSDTLYGYAVTGGIDILDGGTGVDQMSQGEGKAYFYVDNASDYAFDSGASDADRLFTSVSYTLDAGSRIEIFSTTDTAGTGAINLTGNEFAQALVGNAGANILDGKGGADTMTGFAGNDSYYVDTAGDVVVEAANGGTADRVITSISYALGASAQVEILSTTEAAGMDPINLTGNGLAQQIVGNAGINIINGLGGADAMTGFAGNDQYVLDNAGDVVVEVAGGGTADRVLTSVSYTLGAAAQIELFTTTNAAGTGALNLTGNGFAQSIGGNAGVNVLNGGGGADTMTGFAGNDQYYVDVAGDVVVEGAGQGTADRVLTSVSYTLGAAAQIELFTTTNAAGTGALNLTGNAFAQSIGGNAGVNILNGGAGSDTISGFGGADFFLFNTALGASNVDRLLDFSAADTIRLENAIFAALTTSGALASGAYNTGTAATQADDRIIYNATTGVLLYDADGLNGNAGIQFATLNTGLTLTSADFAVV